jgi:hypothetical protein
MSRSARSKKVVFSLLPLILFTVAACGRSNSIEGTYSSQTGAVIDLRSDGKASASILGQTETCTYKVDGKTTLHLTCESGPLDFYIHDDGSLTGSPVFAVLKKSK